MGNPIRLTSQQLAYATHLADRFSLDKRPMYGVPIVIVGTVEESTPYIEAWPEWVEAVADFAEAL